MNRPRSTPMPCRPPVVRRVGAGLRVLAAAVGGLAATAALAQSAPQPAAGIYTCVDDRGRRLTSDRPIAECRAKEQRILNRDGSLKGILPPMLTPEERARKEVRDRREAELRAAQADAVRRDRNLMARYPDETSHARAREAALEPVRVAMRESALRMNELAAERKPLISETEFYVGRSLPTSLQLRLDSNEASMAAQRSIMQAHELELVRINRFYDAELERLRQLWAGAAPGSIVPVASATEHGPARP